MHIFNMTSVCCDYHWENTCIFNRKTECFNYKGDVAYVGVDISRCVEQELAWMVVIITTVAHCSAFSNTYHNLIHRLTSKSQ